MQTCAAFDSKFFRGMIPRSSPVRSGRHAWSDVAETTGLEPDPHDRVDVKLWRAT